MSQDPRRIDKRKLCVEGKRLYERWAAANFSPNRFEGMEFEMHHHTCPICMLTLLPPPL